MASAIALENPDQPQVIGEARGERMVDIKLRRWVRRLVIQS